MSEKTDFFFWFAPTETGKKKKEEDQSDSPLNYKQGKFKVRRCHFWIVTNLHRRALL